MPLPTLEQYNEAAQNPDAFFDPEIAHGRFRKRFNIPLATWGGFALTYTVETQSGKYAVRCFHRDVPNRASRYQAISHKLHSLASPYFVNFSYQENGIRVNGMAFPIVKMAWANGITLGEFVANNFRNKQALTALKNSLLKLSAFLETNHIAHGDIQADNLMVGEDGSSLQLIDYDGIYLPELASYKAEETGHRNFQHPMRASLSPWDEKLDRFSFILLLLVLDALLLEPKLWQETKSSSDKFLLGANDFVDPGCSQAFSKLYAHSALKSELDKFVDICGGDYADIPSVSEFYSGDFSRAESAAISGIKIGYLAPYPVLNAKDYAACLPHVGEMVELIGEIVDVKSGKTYRGAPYYFLNFNDWRGNSVKITVWSDYLKKAKNIDFPSLKGKIVSAIGLLQPPFTSTSARNQEYTSISIFLDRAIDIIDEKEAKYRLNYEKNPLPIPVRKSGRKSQKNYHAANGKSQQFTVDTHVETTKKTASQPEASAKSTARQSASSTALKANHAIFVQIKNSAQKTGISASNSTFQPSSNTPCLVKVNCPACGYLASVPQTDGARIICPACQSEFEYNHSKWTKKIITNRLHENQKTSQEILKASPSKAPNLKSTPTNQQSLYSQQKGRSFLVNFVQLLFILSILFFIIILLLR